MGNPSPLKVLVVDDNPAIRGVLCEALRIEGYDVSSVPGGQEALESVAVSVPDLILVDSIMPGMDGPATIQALRARGVASKIIAISGMADHRAKAMGADEVLMKPLSPEELYEAIRRLGL